MSVTVKLKNNIRKYIRKYIPIVFTLFLIPCISFNAFAYSPENLGDCAYPVRFLDKPYMAIFKTGGIVYQTIYDVTTINSTYPNNVPNQSISYNFTNPNYNINNGVKRIWFENSVSTLDFLYQPDLYDTYLYVTLSSGSIDNFSFRPDSMHILSRSGNTTSTYQLTDLLVMNYASATRGGFTACGKLPVIDNSTFNGFYFVDTSGGTVGADIIMEGIFILLPKDSSAEQLQSVITAINSQTSSLGGKLDGVQSGISQGNNLIDKGNQLIEDGNSGTQSAITDFNQVFDDFNDELENWEQFDDEIIGEFNSANENYKTELNNFSLSGSLLNAGNWLSTSMQTVYDNSSDYKMLWLVPLLFGIPILLFIIRKNGDDE